ncbi:hypothetical protein GCM10007977_025570 [Dactylosporangium sucinum]|uniref:Uncharacterized protein n=1 Tax=Dactylosporangium sucinum TaxID=1424081 RepID=A0A917TI43_9ACTN|nr:hypothetical protein GCM10007977_025570 [Dactylosporangium sucinum]
MSIGFFPYRGTCTEHGVVVLDTARAPGAARAASASSPARSRNLVDHSVPSAVHWVGSAAGGALMLFHTGHRTTTRRRVGRMPARPATGEAAHSMNPRYPQRSGVGVDDSTGNVARCRT